jgi:hypothetical protein
MKRLAIIIVIVFLAAVFLFGCGGGPAPGVPLSTAPTTLPSTPQTAIAGNWQFDTD